ncbi:MAG: hypothetical protein HDR37_03935 [Treponema sp.]|nr:hypothetical protein [Treponema sp.]
MAMNGMKLGDDIAAVITDAKATPEMKAQIKALWEKIGGVIVTHIQTNAQVQAGIPVSVSGAMGASTGATNGTGQIQ